MSSNDARPTHPYGVHTYVSALGTTFRMLYGVETYGSP